MMVTYNRYLRDYRAKLLKAKLERPVPQGPALDSVPGVRVAQVIRQAVKMTMRNMEGQ